MIEEGGIYDFSFGEPELGGKYYLVVGVENNMQSIYQTPFLFHEAAQMIKKKEITIFSYIVIIIKNLKNIKESILECDLDVIPYACFESSELVHKVDLNQYKTDIIKLRLLNKLPCTLSRKDAEKEMFLRFKDYIKATLAKLSSFQIGEIFVDYDNKDVVYLGMNSSFMLLLLNTSYMHMKYITVESFLHYYQSSGKHREMDTTAYTLPKEMIRQSGIL